MSQWADAIMDKIVTKFLSTVPKATQQGIIPYRGGKNEWIGAPYEGNGWWTGGFWPGLLWLLYAESKEPLFSEEARRVQKLLRDELLAHHRLSHDVGFMFLLSFGAELRVTGNQQSAQILLQAADFLAGRYNPAGFIRAWNGMGRAGWVIIDSLMNLPLLYWASAHTGDPRYAKIANNHADTSIRHFIRANGSCNHIVIFDAETGEALEAPGGQGYAPGSSWSRGQAWGLYGFLLAYLNSGKAQFLSASRLIADYFISHIRSDGLTDCDFCQPSDAERIDNIAGACAASGLLLMADTVGGEAGSRYRNVAFHMLKALDALCADYTEDCFGVLQKCTAAYHDDGAGRHVNIVYGDFFYTEAVSRVMKTHLNLWSSTFLPSS